MEKAELKGDPLSDRRNWIRGGGGSCLQWKEQPRSPAVVILSYGVRLPQSEHGGVEVMMEEPQHAPVHAIPALQANAEMVNKPQSSPNQF